MSTAETKVVICPHCGQRNYAFITHLDRLKDEDWDDGTCVACARPIVSARCGSIRMARSQVEMERVSHR